MDYLLRKQEAALSWYRSQPQLSISIIVKLEVIEGSQNKQDLRRNFQLLADFNPVYLNSLDFDWAVEQQIQYRLSHGIQFTDCLIASSAHRLELPLYALNMKHFSVLLGSLAMRPY
jgi:predicted nucleic acid-binding protein